MQFSGALTLTHNATSLILPGGASITTAAGDVATWSALGWQLAMHGLSKGERAGSRRIWRLSGRLITDRAVQQRRRVRRQVWLIVGRYKPGADTDWRNGYNQQAGCQLYADVECRRGCIYWLEAEHH